MTCQKRGCVLHGVKMKFGYFKDVGSNPHVKSILSQLLCSQVHLMSCSFADSPVVSMETFWLVSVPSLLFIIHSFRLRQCFTGHVKPRQGACPSQGMGREPKPRHSVTPARGQAGGTLDNGSTAQGPESLTPPHISILYSYILYEYVVYSDCLIHPCMNYPAHFSLHGTAGVLPPPARAPGAGIHETISQQ